MPQTFDIWTAFAMSLLISLAWNVVTRRRARVREAVIKYDAAAANLRQHYEAMEAFVTDPAAPASAVEILLAVSDISADRDLAAKLARRLCEKKKLGAPSAEDQAMMADLAKLATSRPDLNEAFETALASGIVAMFLRWPETVELLPRYAARLTNRRQEAVIARAATDQFREKGQGSIMLGAHAAMA
ncbi:hypothetical protein FHS55_002122 [Angulomicrobium tetraedrale]|uniref:Uncharacterized protein n=1 Tax=Ancylobacter tetraedralis TaxID=217068 RepID=A0A839Z9W3_9HYPH|nr:hypothetical protein [Ancylobacter tetraedralis]MBB3771523.1 hypothetical protein [Ancylobacter tetraedralis]